MHVAVQHVCSYAKHITSKNQDSPVVEGWNSGERCFSINCNEVIEIVEPQCINSHKTTKKTVAQMAAMELHDWTRWMLQSGSWR
jgi:hypothetical protein